MFALGFAITGVSVSVISVGYGLVRFSRASR